MAASKKTGASSKKGGASKSSSSPTLAVQGKIPKLTMDFPIDAKKIAAIQKCIAKGRLSITVSNVDLAAGRLGDAWLYD